MKMLYSSIVGFFAVSALTFASLGDGPSLDDLVTSPEKFTGQTLVFEQVMLSGDMTKGTFRYRLTVKTPAGKMIDGEPHPKGITFVISFKDGDEIKPLLRGGTFQPVRIVCKITMPGKSDKFVALVTKIEPLKEIADVKKQDNGKKAANPETLLRYVDLLKRLKSGTDNEKLDALDELKSLGTKGRFATKAVCHAMLDADPKVKDAAAETLEVNDKYIYKHATTLLVDKSASEHRQTLIDLERKGGDAKTIMPILVNRYDFYSKAAEPQWNTLAMPALSAMARIDSKDKTVISYIQESLNGKQAVVVLGAQKLIDRDNPKDYAPTLIKLLDATYPSDKGKQVEVRIQAITMLGEFGRDAWDAVPRLRQMKKDENARVRNAATTALEHIQAR